MDALLQLFSLPIFTIRNQEFTLGAILAVPFIIWAGYYLFHKGSAVIELKLQQRGVARDAILLVQRIYMIVSLVVVFITVLELLHIPLTAFAFISGAIAIGIGFGAQNIINNFISGWIIMWERPIRIGDFLEIGDIRGRVETINIRATLVRRIDGVHVLIPNSYFLQNTVVNWTLVDKMVRSVIRVGVAYGSPVKRVAELIELAATSHEDILTDPAPVVAFEDFGDNALIFDLYFWIDSFGDKDLRGLRSSVRYKIDELFSAENIVIAFPQRDIHIDGHLKISNESLPPSPSEQGA